MEKQETQTTDTILMIEPVSFGFNEQTAVNNFFQQKENIAATDVQSRAVSEFRRMVEKLRSKGIDIIVVQDTPEPQTPDSIFPNNWISFHQDGRVAMFPMYAENRRAERRQDIFDVLREKGIPISKIADYTYFEKQNRFLEGTGSMVFDHRNKIAYAALSERTNKDLVLQFCADFSFMPVCFLANQTVNGKRRPIYHTNVMMCIGDKYAVICLNAIDDANERNQVRNSLHNSGKEIIEITEQQMLCFAGNMLQVQNKEGEKFLVMSQTAFNSLSNHQKERLIFYNEIISVDIATIENNGGGSARCMMAEVFKKQEQME